jgi:phosphomannomutase
MRPELEKDLFRVVDNNTPKDVKENPLFNLNDKNEFEFRLTKELVKKYKLREWFNNYKKEALVSTGGIRGPQNILYPWDTRFPINQMGVALATLGKALVANKKNVNKKIQKLSTCEVRYNSKLYVELIARIQAANNIYTYVPEKFRTSSIWMSSFLIFMLDLYGGEYVTSSHAVSTKIATKDLNTEGSQYVPKESLEFINMVDKILKKAEKKEFIIKFSKKNDKRINFDFYNNINDGVDLYCDYLKSGVATKRNIKFIKNHKGKIIIECVGGCMYNMISKIFKKFKIYDNYEFFK